MKLGKRQWLMGFGVALALHVAVLAAFHVPMEGAKDEGEEGVEVGLMLAGALPAPQAAKEPETAPEPVRVPHPEPPQPEVTVEPTREAPVVEPVQDESAPKILAVKTEKPKEQKKEEKKVVEKSVLQPAADEPAAISQQAEVATAHPETSSTADERALGTAEQQLAGEGQQIAQGGDPAARASYFAELAAWLNRHKRYPPAAKRRRMEGIVTLEFTINKQGELLASRVATGSDQSLLDQAALEMIKRASPLPAIPSHLHREELTITLPVEFSLTR